jgi:hypothetical protein
MIIVRNTLRGKIRSSEHPTRCDVSVMFHRGAQKLYTLHPQNIYLNDLLVI